MQDNPQQLLLPHGAQDETTVWYYVTRFTRAEAERLFDERIEPSYTIDGATYDVNDKPSNPKDIIGSNKLPLGLIPGSTQAYLALGHSGFFLPIEPG